MLRSSALKRYRLWTIEGISAVSRTQVRPGSTVTLASSDHLGDYGAGLVSAFDHVSDVYVFAKDDQRRFVACSKPFARLLGFSAPEHLLGLRDEELSPEYLADHYRRHDQEILSTGGPLVDLVELVRNVDGSYDWFLTTKVPVADDTGRVIGIAGVTRALTTRTNPTAERLMGLTPAVELISAEYPRTLTVAEMAASVSMSSSSFSRTFRDHFGCTPAQYLRRVRVMAACDLLSTTDAPMSEIASATGFFDQSHFTREFRRSRGVTPTAYRQTFGGRSWSRTSRMSVS